MAPGFSESRWFDIPSHRYMLRVAVFGARRAQYRGRLLLLLLALLLLLLDRGAAPSTVQ